MKEDYFAKLKQIEDADGADAYVLREYNAFLEETQMTEWALAKKWHIWRCFWCDHATGQSYIRCYEVKCTIKDRYFKPSYRCKIHFKLQVDKKRSLLFMEWWERWV